MKVGLAYPIDSLSGKAAARSGLVYFMWRGMQVARRWVIPANPDTVDQDTIRAYLAAAAKGFQSVTPVQKTMWTALGQIYAKKVQGVDVVMPEISAYCMINQWRQIAGEALTADAPTAKPNFAVTGIQSATIIAPNISIAFTHSAAVPAGNFVALKMTAPLPSLMKVPTDSDYRMITTVSEVSCIVALTESPQTIVIATADLWTPVDIDDVVGFSIMPLSDEYAPGLEYDKVLTIAA